VHFIVFASGPYVVSRHNRVSDLCVALREIKKWNISLTKGCAKDNISPMGCNHPMRMGSICVGGI